MARQAPAAESPPSKDNHHSDFHGILCPLVPVRTEPPPLDYCSYPGVRCRISVVGLFIWESPAVGSEGC